MPDGGELRTLCTPRTRVGLGFGNFDRKQLVVCACGREYAKSFGRPCSLQSASLYFASARRRLQQSSSASRNLDARARRANSKRGTGWASRLLPGWRR